MLSIFHLLVPSVVTRALTASEMRQYKEEGAVKLAQLLPNVPSNTVLSSTERRLPNFRVLDLNSRSRMASLDELARDLVPVAAQILSTTSDNVRIVNDASFVLNPTDPGCGWHVDDDRFVWPSSKEGCNLWIPFTRLTSQTGGRLAIVPYSHTLPWCVDARSIIGTGTDPSLTCQLEELAPDVHAKFEYGAVFHDMDVGDAIANCRYCFHRTERIRDGRTTRLAYSVRYEKKDDA